MATYIALFRGVNVGGKMLPMEKLRATLGRMGFAGVRTLLQSGNAVFEASKRSTKSIAQEVERKVLEVFGLESTTFVLTSSELQKAMKSNPYKASKLDPSRIALCFLSAKPARTGLKALAAVESGPDEFRCIGNVLYLHCPNGFARTKLSLAQIERSLGVRGTARNWNTILKLCEMTSERSG